MKENSSLSIFKILIVVSFIGILIIISIPNHGTGDHRPRYKSCYSNIRILQGAVEMYNIDHQNILKTIAPENYNHASGTLVLGKYLKTPLNDLPTTKCEYHSFGDLTSSGTIYCITHGALGSESKDLLEVLVDSFDPEYDEGEKKSKMAGRPSWWPW